MNNFNDTGVIKWRFFMTPVSLFLIFFFNKKAASNAALIQ